MATRARIPEPAGEIRFEQEHIEEAIRDYPREAEEALALVQRGAERPLAAASIRAFAADAGEEVQTFWYGRLEARNLVAAFGMALRAAGVPVGMDAADVEDEDNVPFARRQRFDASASAFRCRIMVNGSVLGSGCLVGPSLVLTAWHVIAVAAPDDPQSPLPQVEILLADGTRIEADFPPLLQYPCARCEFTSGGLPKTDNDLEDRHDVALLTLKRPAALHLGAALLPEEAPAFRSRAVYLVHYPKGKDVGVGTGPVRKIARFGRRWAHTIQADAGSSGGGCFDTRFRLIGIHQGRLDVQRRLVPVTEFLARLRKEVANDIAPTTIWSLDGRIDGQLVLGRDDFFIALAEAGKSATSVRGIKVKRTDAAGDLSGIPFTFALIEQVLCRPATPPFLVRISFDAAVGDLPGEILRRARLSGLDTGELLTQDGVAPGETAPEAVEADRGRRAATLVNSAAAAADRLAWIFIEHPSVIFTETPRYALEAFIDQALRLPNLRLVVAGFEAVALPGTEFQTLEAAGRSPTPGFLVDYLRGFSRQDVVNLVDRALAELHIETGPGWSAGVTTAAVAGVPRELGRYARAHVQTVVERVRESLREAANGGGQ